MNKSFTLIEILVVIVVIGVLSAFILVGMSSITSSANIAKGKTYANSMRNSLLLSLVSEWKLDGNANDSWKTNNGTLVGPILLPVLKTGSECASGSCYQFDGSEDYINIIDNNSLDITGKVTVGMWVKSNNINQSEAYIFSKGTTVSNNNLNIVVWPAQALQISWGNGTSYTGGHSFSQFFNTTSWTYSVVTIDSSYLKAYKNGVLFDSWANPISGFSMNNTNPLRLACYSGDGYYFNGLLDEITFYNEVLSSSQINQNYYSGLNSLLVNNSFEKAEYIERLSQLKSNLSEY